MMPLRTCRDKRPDDRWKEDSYDAAPFAVKPVPGERDQQGSGPVSAEDSAFGHSA